jgi:hypothetical protein
MQFVCWVVSRKSQLKFEVKSAGTAADGSPAAHKALPSVVKVTSAADVPQ